MAGCLRSPPCKERDLGSFFTCGERVLVSEASSTSASLGSSLVVVKVTSEWWELINWYSSHDKQQGFVALRIEVIIRASRF